jgi:hypothetical protein
MRERFEEGATKEYRASFWRYYGFERLITVTILRYLITIANTYLHLLKVRQIFPRSSCEGHFLQ